MTASQPEGGMQNGSSEEEDCKTEAGPQDRGGEENDGEEDGHRSSQDREEKIGLQEARGSTPRLLYFHSKTIGYKPTRRGSPVFACNAARGAVAAAFGVAARRVRKPIRVALALEQCAAAPIAHRPCMLFVAPRKRRMMQELLPHRWLREKPAEKGFDSFGPTAGQSTDSLFC
ncbi:MAG TPA: hypothetical protein VNJ31_03340 [Methyloceanibacter sp.]|nr:hypothetical protein [Methyloceanibacter sp.]